MEKRSDGMDLEVRLLALEETLVQLIPLFRELVGVLSQLQAHGVEPNRAVGKKLLSMGEASKALSMCDTLFRREVRAGKVPCLMIGNRRKFTLEGLQRYLDGNAVVVPTPGARTLNKRGARGIGIIELARAERAKGRRK